MQNKEQNNRYIRVESELFSRVWDCPYIVLAASVAMLIAFAWLFIVAETSLR